MAEPFITKDGVYVYDLLDLLEILSSMGDDIFIYHFERGDFPRWVENELDDNLLAEILRLSQNKSQMVRLVKKRIKERGEDRAQAYKNIRKIYSDAVEYASKESVEGDDKPKAFNEPKEETAESQVSNSLNSFSKKEDESIINQGKEGQDLSEKDTGKEGLSAGTTSFAGSSSDNSVLSGKIAVEKNLSKTGDSTGASSGFVPEKLAASSPSDGDQSPFLPQNAKEKSSVSSSEQGTPERKTNLPGQDIKEQKASQGAFDNQGAQEEAKASFNLAKQEPVQSPGQGPKQEDQGSLQSSGQGTSSPENSDLQGQVSKGSEQSQGDTTQFANISSSSENKPVSGRSLQERLQERLNKRADEPVEKLPDDPSAEVINETDEKIDDNTGVQENTDDVSNETSVTGETDKSPGDENKTPWGMSIKESEDIASQDNVSSDTGKSEISSASDRNDSEISSDGKADNFSENASENVSDEKPSDSEPRNVAKTDQTKDKPTEEIGKTENTDDLKNAKTISEQSDSEKYGPADEAKDNTSDTKTQDKSQDKSYQSEVSFDELTPPESPFEKQFFLQKEFIGFVAGLAAGLVLGVIISLFLTI